MKLQKNTHLERGQALILIAGLIFSLVAMVGLAVDGGGLYFLDRDLTNAADAAVIAATYAKCTGGDIEFAARRAIADNGFIEGGSDNVFIDINNPPERGQGVGNHSYVEVIVQAQKPSYFIQVVHDQPLVVSARSVGYCNTSLSGSAGRAVFGACDAGGDAVKIVGSGECAAEIDGGIHSESGGHTGPNSCVNGSVTSGDDPSHYTGTITGGTQLESHPDYPITFNIEDFDSATKDIPRAYIETFANPSAYWIVPDGTTELTADDLVIPGTNPGDAARLIYVPPSVGNLKIRAGSTVVSGTLYVTIVSHNSIEFTGQIDSFEFINGGEHPAFMGTNPSKYLLAFSTKGTQAGCSGGGLSERALMFSAPSSTWRGLFFAPNGTVSMSLSSNLASYGGIFAWTVDLQGSSIKISYDAEMVPGVPPKIGFAE